MSRPIFARRYELLRPLGAGQYGEVHLAHDLALPREVALKVLMPGTPFSHALFEARRLHSVRGDHTLEVIDTGIYVDIPYIVTAYAENGSVAERCRPHGLDPATAVPVARAALVGLQACHDVGVLHRDVKPDNVFLNSREEALLGDFGVSALMDANGTAPPHGDPAYLAPEVINGEPTSVSSDVYMMGATLYELLAGQAPFPFSGDPADFADLVARVTRADYPPLGDAAPHLPQRLLARVATAMSVDPADRFDSAAEFEAELGRLPRFIPSWQRVADSTWETVVPRGGAKRVQVSEEAGRFTIAASHIDSGRAIRKASTRGVPARRLEVELRKAFRQLG